MNHHGYSRGIICSRVFEGNPSKFRDWIKSIEKHVLLADGDANQSKELAYETSEGAVSDYIQHYITEYPNSTQEQLKLEISGRFAEVCKYDEVNGESKRINRNETNMPIFHTELAGNPNSGWMK